MNFKRDVFPYRIRPRLRHAPLRNRTRFSQRSSPQPLVSAASIPNRRSPSAFSRLPLAVVEPTSRTSRNREFRILNAASTCVRLLSGDATQNAARVMYEKNGSPVRTGRSIGTESEFRKDNVINFCNSSVRWRRTVDPLNLRARPLVPCDIKNVYVVRAAARLD